MGLNPDISFLNTAIKSNLNPKYISVFVTGRVNLPGLKVIPKKSTVNDALELSMEYLQSVQKDNLTVVNEALNELYIHDEDTESLRSSIDVVQD